ncbi:MAG: fused MFS/spermidine synthase [Deltaproteobacteria bacterium]|nr:fused MFS/spermidine synthase [Deltaproteobacteria bacterium]
MARVDLTMGARSTSQTRRRWLALVFFLSGAASLVYQVVWQRLLCTYYGASAISSAVIVSVFLLGLGIGAALGGKIVERRAIRLAHYAVLETCIGAFGIASTPALRALGATTAGSDYVTATLLVAAFLAVPTVLMGMTLPLVVKMLERESGLLASLSWFYGLNTLGAAFGAFVASYLLVTFLGLDGATYAAAAVNLSLALFLRIALSRGNAQAEEGSGGADPLPARAQVEPSMAPGRVYAVVFATGFLAIGYQIVWFRIIGVLLKDSPYAFATTLSVYLAAIGAGSAWIHRRERREPNASRAMPSRDLFFLVNGVIGVTGLFVPCALHALAARPFAKDALDWLARIPILPTPPSDGTTGFVVTLTLTLGISTVVVGAPAFLMGASFPLVASLLPRRDDAPASSAATAYAVTVLGNVVGGLVTAFILLAHVGTERTLLAFGAAGLLFFVEVRRVGTRELRPLVRLAVAGSAIVVAALASPSPGALYRSVLAPIPGATGAYVEEGAESVVVTYEKGEAVRNYINGSKHGGRPIGVFWREAAVALAYVRQPEHVLVIGFGTGSVHELALLDPRVRKITLVELDATLLRNLRKMPLFERMLADPRVEIVIDDARRHLQRTSTRFDAILMDPLRSRSALSNNLYSKELFELAGSRLSDGGVILVWTDEHIVVPRTVASSLPFVVEHGCEPVLWSFLVAGRTPLDLDRAGLAERFAGLPEHIQRAAARIECPARADREGILARTRGRPINETHRPVTEFYLRTVD